MDPTQLDRVRDWRLGRLSPGDAERVRAEVERDPELAAFAASFGDLVALTELARDDAPPARTTFEALERRLEAESQAEAAPARPWRRAAAAAVVLAAAAAATPYAWRALVGPRALELAATPLAPVERETEPVDVPERLTDWRPAMDGKIAWVKTMEEASRVARASERPVFLFGMLPTCPWCKELAAGTFSDPRVIAALERVVPLELDLMTLGEERMSEMMALGYPVFAVLDADLEIVHEFGEYSYRPTAEELMQQIELALGKLGDDAPPPWERVQELARVHEEARAAEAGGDLGLAYARYGELAELPESDSNPALFLEGGRRGLARLDAAAREALLDAYELAATDRARALEQLDAALVRFRGAPHEADLRALREALARGGERPELSAAR